MPSFFFLKLMLFSPSLNIFFFRLLLVLFLDGTIPFCFIPPFNLPFSLRDIELGWKTKQSTNRSFRDGVRSGLGLGLGLVRVRVDSNQIKNNRVSCVAGGFLTRQWRARDDGDKGGDTRNVL